MPRGQGRGGRDREELDPSEFFRIRTPDHRNREMYGIADQLVGGSRIKVNCEDGRSRLGRIPGKMKRRMWIRTGDLLVLKPWDFQDDKCDILFRYTRTQAIHLSKRNMVPKSIDIY
ncbi:MAG: translation initiation factor eIF-1A [Euryarchaeota archaeon]|nr:translation initiation factor eIF-1A [Euryarchaeota archaeon]